MEQPNLESPQYFVNCPKKNLAHYRSGVLLIDECNLRSQKDCPGSLQEDKILDCLSIV